MHNLSFKNYLVESFTLIESFNDAQRIFSQHNDPDDVAAALKTYKKLLDANRISPENRDITKWIKRPFDDFIRFVDHASSSPSVKQQKKNLKGESIPLDTFGDWIALIPLSKGASCYYGKGTQWCTAATESTNYFNSYFDKGVTLIYFINKKTGDRYAAALYPDGMNIEYFNAQDDEIDKNSLSSSLGIDETRLNSLIKKAHKHDGVSKFKEDKERAKIQAKADALLNQKDKKFISVDDLNAETKKLGELLFHTDDLSYFLSHDTVQSLRDLRTHWIEIGTEMKSIERKHRVITQGEYYLRAIDTLAVHGDIPYMEDRFKHLAKEIWLFISTVPSQTFLPKDVKAKLTQYANKYYRESDQES